MNKDYTQPFCIIGSKGKFHPSYSHYLPALESPIEDIPKEETIIRHVKSNITLHPQIGRLRNDFEDLKREFHEHTQHLNRKKDKYIIN